MKYVVFCESSLVSNSSKDEFLSLPIKSLYPKASLMMIPYDISSETVR